MFGCLESIILTNQSKDFFWNLASFFLQGVLFVLIARSNSPKDFAVIVANLSAGILIAALLDLGSSASAYRSISIEPENLHNEFQKIWGRILILTIAMLSIIVFLYLTSFEILILGPITFIVCIDILISHGLGVFTKFLIGTFIPNLILSLQRILIIIFYLIFNSISHSLAEKASITFAIFLGLIFSLLFNLMLLKKYVVFPAFKNWIKYLSLGQRDYAIQTFSTAIMHLESTILISIGNSFNAGILGAVRKWSIPINAIGYSENAVLVQEAGKGVKLDSILYRLFRSKKIQIIPILSIFLAIIFSPLIVSILLPESYSKASTVLVLLSINAYIEMWNTMFLTLILVKIPYSKIASFQLFCAMFFLCFLLIKGKFLSASEISIVLILSNIILLFICITYLIKLILFERQKNR